MEVKIKEPKIQSLRLLRSHSIPYKFYEYPIKFSNAQEVARFLAIPEGNLYKTLVSKGSSNEKPLLSLIPSNRALNLKKLAMASQNKRVKMVTYNEAEKLTGLRVGGISALALLHKKWQVFLDSSSQEMDSLVMNAGKRGFQVEIACEDFINLVSATVTSIT